MFNTHNILSYQNQQLRFQQNFKFIIFSILQVPWNIFSLVDIKLLHNATRSQRLSHQTLINSCFYKEAIVVLWRPAYLQWIGFLNTFHDRIIKEVRGDRSWRCRLDHDYNDIWVSFSISSFYSYSIKGEVIWQSF